jgi:DNA processing protein
MELISESGQDTLPLARGPQRATDALSESQLAVFEAVPARRRASVGEIALAAGVSVPTCLAALGELEAAGLVEGDERGWLATFGRPR